ncbi:MAG: STAS domain-containing protein [Chitinivibrionales bacterium]|nr:STAS domain-containing protein [Chitinivibrionales bacterium]
MNISTKPNGTHVVFEISGDMRGRDFAELLSKMRESAYTNLIVDLSQLRYIDSQGLGGLLYSNKILSMSGKKLTLMSPQQYVKKIFSDYSLDQVLNIADPEPVCC